MMASNLKCNDLARNVCLGNTQLHETIMNRIESRCVPTATMLLSFIHIIALVTNIVVARSVFIRVVNNMRGSGRAVSRPVPLHCT